ncbi:hypothetical protein FH972_027116 [Carpinus fangiana]|uniref:EF-hand domain-containing protein n=1 Tax=Carpinus fangiana TaxID=176857 RepID=A0A5N6L6C9_9ROSI|nr:hypothetical protein FH972_027116 [Carpinus fangiana]
MDTNRDGLVSLNEFVDFFRLCGYRWSDPNFFHCLDRNRDGCLDFNEVLTLYYIVKTRGVCCDQCRTCLMGLYFTCVECFDTANDTYDLCATCYSARSFHHHHATFLDNYVLLRSREGFLLALVPPPYAANAPQEEMSASEALEMGITVGSSLDCSEANEANEALEALEMAIAVGSVLGCSIM